MAIWLRKARTLARLALGQPQPLIHARLRQRELIVRAGAVRSQPDYDDAWLYACALRARFVLDIGANVGQAALIALLSPTVERIVLVDANAAALATAAENLIRSGLAHRAGFETAFVSDRADEQITFWTFDTAPAGSAYVRMARSASRRGASIRVPTTTIDALCRRFAFAPDLVKIDVEGAEWAALAGAGGLAGDGNTRWLVELHARPDLPMTRGAADLLAWCAAHGLRAWYLAAHEELTAPDQLAARGRCHVLLQPAAWGYPDWLRGIPEGAPLESVPDP